MRNWCRFMGPYWFRGTASKLILDDVGKRTAGKKAPIPKANFETTEVFIDHGRFTRPRPRENARYAYLRDLQNNGRLRLHGHRSYFGPVHNAFQGKGLACNPLILLD